MGTDDFTWIQKAAPQTKLILDPSWTADPELKDRLDYGKVDDEVVGCLYKFRNEHPEADARLLTHDSGPMASAKMLNVPFVPVPDDWLLPPESTHDEKEKRRLQSEVNRLKKAEPNFRVRCLDDAGSETEDLTFEYGWYDPLTEDVVEKYMEKLRVRFPLATDFARPKPVMLHRTILECPVSEWC